MHARDAFKDDSHTNALEELRKNYSQSKCDGPLVSVVKSVCEPVKKKHTNNKYNRRYVRTWNAYSSQGVFVLIIYFLYYSDTFGASQSLATFSAAMTRGPI